MTDRLLLAQISVDIRDLQKQMQKAGFSVETTGRRMAQNWKTTTSAMARDTDQFGRDVRRAISGIALATVTSEVTDLADAWTRASNQISAAAAASGTAGVSLSAIADIARATRTDFDATATLYARLTRATADLGASQQQVIQATQLINKSFVAGGASAQEQASAILQLSQALSSGVLQGDELRSLRESSPLLLQAIAKEFGVAQGALKALGAEGKLTSDRIFQAILNAAPQIDAQFSVTQSTVADTFTNLRTAAIEYVGQLNDSLGVTVSFGQVVDGLADNFDFFANALLGTTLLLGARGLGGALNKAVGDFGKYASGIGTRRQKLIKDLQDEVDAARLQARQAAINVQAEQDGLDKIRKARDAAARANTGDDRAIIQTRQLALARRDLIAAENALAAAQGKKKVSTDEVEAATRRLTLAQANLNAIERQRVAGVAQADALATQEIAQSQALTRAKNDLQLANQRLGTATAALNKAMRPLLGAGMSLLNLFGGPLGVAFIAAGAAMAYFAGEAMKADQATQNVNAALSILSEGYGVSSGLARDAAGATAELTAQINAQAAATAALQEIERQSRRDQYIQAIETARDRIEKLEKEIGQATGATFDLASAFKYNRFTPEDEFNEKLEKARDDLADMTRYLGILEAGFAGLEAIGFEKPKVSSDLPNAPPPDATETDSEIEARLKKEQTARERAAQEAERLVEGLRTTWRGFYEYRDEAISRELAEDLAAIDKAALSAEAAAEARTLAEQSAAAKRRELMAEEIDEAEEAYRLKEEAAQREIDLVARVMDERDRMLGRTLSIVAREFEARRAAIEEQIKDEQRKNDALKALAAEEAEFKRLAREDAFALGGPGVTEAQRIETELQTKLALLQEYRDLELITEQEFQDEKNEIIATASEELKNIKRAEAAFLLDASSSVFGSLASLARTFAGEQSGIFKALFIAEKAAALASAYINMQLAISKANAIAPPPFNAPAILAAKVTGAAAIAGILASTAAGFKKGGYTGDGDPNTVAGAVHRGEYVFDAKATKRLGIANLEALRAGRMPSTLPGAVAPAPARSVSFGDMIVSVSGNGAAEIRDELAAALDQHRRTILSDVDRNFGSMQAREIKRTTPRFERPRP